MQIVTNNFVEEILKPPSLKCSIPQGEANIYIYIYVQSVTGGTDQTSGVCSLGHTIPI